MQKKSALSLEGFALTGGAGPGPASQEGLGRTHMGHKGPDAKPILGKPCSSDPPIPKHSEVFSTKTASFLPRAQGVRSYVVVIIGHRAQQGKFFYCF